jgi:predicted site-specific integrase-resolvase
MVNKDRITLKEAGEILGKATSTLRYWCEDGKLKTASQAAYYTIWTVSRKEVLKIKELEQKKSKHE